MILRLGATAAIFGAGGVVVGVTGTLAAYTILRGLGGNLQHKMQNAAMPQMPPSPYTPPSASTATEDSGPNTSGAMSGMR